MAGKPMLGDDEEDALSMVMGGAPSEEDEESPAIEASEESAEEPEKSDSGRILDEVQAKLEELRGLVASV